MNETTNTGDAAPKSWMIESILCTIFCCLPFGIIGIINAAKVADLYKNGNVAEAEAASAAAKKWTLIGAGVGLVVTVLYIVVMALGA